MMRQKHNEFYTPKGKFYNYIIVSLSQPLWCFFVEICILRYREIGATYRNHSLEKIIKTVS